MGIVLVFCFGCGYGLFFCLCCLALFFWIAFGCVWLLFLCVLFWLAFRFALFLVLYPFLSLSWSAGPFRFPSGVWHAKSAAALRCRLFPGSIRRHRRDIDPIAVWNGSRPARRNRMVVQAWFRYRMAVKERPIPWRTVFPRGRTGLFWPICFWTDIRSEWSCPDIGFDGWEIPISGS